MSYSISRLVTYEEYTKLVPRFLQVLKKYGYSDAKLMRSVQVKKRDKTIDLRYITVNDLIKQLETHDFHLGRIQVDHQGKKIFFGRSLYTNNLIFELNFTPDDTFKNDLEKILSRKR